MSTSGSELPQARIARGAIPAHVRYSLDEHERSELPKTRLDSGGTPPRIARGATPADVRYPLDEHERSELP